MMTVRYPTGVAVTFNDANWLTPLNDGSWDLYTAEPAKGGRWVARVQAGAGATLEVVRATKVETADMDVRKAAELLADRDGELERLPGYVLRVLKARLARFNAKTWTWRK